MTDEPDFVRVMRQLRIPLTENQRAACEYLEWRGKRFLKDYGWQNAVDEATRLFIKRMETA